LVQDGQHVKLRESRAYLLQSVRLYGVFLPTAVAVAEVVDVLVDDERPD
jgi:hypothetical protein